MTAIIATLNKHGVAIASDSAATISNGIIGKVYNTANKLFALSKIHPLGIMICGNAEFMGILNCTPKVRHKTFEVQFKPRGG